jgi:hypothetical protein
MKLIKVVISLNEEKIINESISLFEDVAKALQPYIALLTTSSDGTKNPFTKDVSKPIPIDGFSKFLAGLTVLLDSTNLETLGADFETPEKTFEFFSNIGKPVRRYGLGKQTAQEVVVGVGKKANTIAHDFARRMQDWSNPKTRTSLVNEVKKLALQWDRKLNSFKTQLNKTQLSRAA